MPFRKPPPSPGLMKSNFPPARPPPSPSKKQSQLLSPALASDSGNTELARLQNARTELKKLRTDLQKQKWEQSEKSKQLIDQEAHLRKEQVELERRQQALEAATLEITRREQKVGMDAEQLALDTLNFDQVACKALDDRAAAVKIREEELDHLERESKEKIAQRSKEILRLEKESYSRIEERQAKVAKEEQEAAETRKLLANVSCNPH